MKAPCPTVMSPSVNERKRDNDGCLVMDWSVGQSLAARPLSGRVRSWWPLAEPISAQALMYWIILARP